MAKIHELSEALSNQIAAGEVIERPASVVKELVENAIDAHATQIDIRIVKAGLDTIQVTDNGDGIEQDDVDTAFKRHATSKIHDRNDLFRVRSLGFRGEALASIASVADVTLETSTGEVGTAVHIKGGDILDQHLEAVRKGTALTVRDLFYNTPARLKYVKSYQTELAHIVDIVNRLAMGHPQIAFTLKNEHGVQLKTAGTGDLQQTIAGIYGVSVAQKLLPVHGETPDFELDGYVSLPELTRASRQYISLLINGRYVKNTQLNKAIIAGYGSKLMVGRYPVVILNLQMDPLLVDVNVHPTKREVRLSKEADLAKLIQATIRTKLAQQNLIPDALRNQQQKKTANHIDLEQLQMNLNQISSQQQSYSNSGIAEAAPQPYQTQAPASLPDEAADDGQSIFTQPQRLAAWDAKYQTDVPAVPFPNADDQPAETSPVETAETQAAESQRFPTLRYLGQVHGTYLVAEGPDGFYMVDQHAAQERINYEKFRVAIGEVSPDQQNLLVPLVLDYPNTDAIRIREQLPLLEAVGIHLEPFGQNSFVVHSHPTWMQPGHEEKLTRGLIDELLAGHKLTVASFREKTAIMASCKQAIKANHHLDDQQARALLAKLATTEDPFNCPHGRPVLIHFSAQDLQKMFKRIQDPHESWNGEE
ncbi:DNA mismatch repair protein mutL [Lactobacillus selangorensis]|uniref:DNA mismatch repair protein MutL n=1 Tax=Lactobacillus selangorensis TaxID=81857 RepID=A0A0R2FSA4_9LACO|nr:DNA mismatch repair endonuclease MutL [Lactobacillus selangorensis]KRN27440.1 DNA mismatch repair protein mutL [Lactobacillus selangorensis]KRN31363.1 DNA mismatch repair protein mutL [Lactobacillus selangorensis]